MSSYDFVVIGTGSGGGTIVRRLVEQFPFSTVLALESGKDLVDPAARRADSLQSETDDRIRATWPFRALPSKSNYGDPGSPYGPGGPAYSGDLNFTAPAIEQQMGQIVGGSSHHNGMMALRGSPEDYDEWDYALRDGSTSFVIPGLITWAGLPALTADAAAEAAIQAQLATGRSVFISATDNPKGAPPFRVASAPGAGVINITAGAEAIPWTVTVLVDGVAGATLNFNGGAAILTAVLGAPAVDQYQTNSGTTAADAANLAAAINAPANSFAALGITASVLNSTVVISGPASMVLTPAAAEISADSAENAFLSPWNRARMLECYIAVENDIDSTAYGGAVNPFGVTGSIHGINGWTEIGRVGRRRTQNTDPTRPWLDQRPGVVVPRQAQTQLEMIESLTFSNATNSAYPAPDDGLGGSTYPYLDDYNNWSLSRPAGVASGSSWGRTWQIPLNYVGFDGAEPVACGHHLAKIGKYDKYDERRSTLVTAIDAVRSLQTVTLDITLPAVPPPGEVTVGQTLTGGSGATATVTAAEARQEVIYVLAAQIIAGVFNPVPAGIGYLSGGGAVPGAIITDGGAKSGTVVFNTTTSAPGAAPGDVDLYATLTLSLAPGTVPFVSGDPLAPFGAGPVAATFADFAGASHSPQVTQRLQLRPTAGSFSASETASTPSAAGTLLQAPVTNLALIDHAAVQKIEYEATKDQIDVVLVSAAPFAPAPAVGDAVIGPSGSATVISVDNNLGLTDRSFVRLQLISGTISQGDVLAENAAAWTATASRVDTVHQVTGVVYFRPESNGGPDARYVASTSNVVVCAGPINTPAVLQRSGIGPADRLGAAGIEQQIRLDAVGDRAIQHTIYGTMVFFMNALRPTDRATYVLQFGSLTRTSQNRSAAALGLPAGTTLWEVGNNNPSGPLLFDEDMDCTNLFIAGGGGPDSALANATGGFGLSTKRGNAGPQMQAAIGNPFGVYTQSRLGILSAAGWKPRSRGRGVFITSDSPYDLPDVDHGTVSDWRSKDAEALLEAVDQGFAKITDPTVPGGFQANAMSGFAFPFVTPPPGSGADGQRISRVISSMGAAYHIVGTCAMGPSTDQAAPLDDRAKLRHMIGVRVADTSPFPTHTRANPHLPVVALAYNVADMIFEDGGC